MQTANSSEKAKVENLMNPRIICIANDTSGDFDKGDIFYADNDGKFYVHHDTGRWVLHYDYYPHLFRKLHWWEERTAKEMPRYIKTIIESKEVFCVKQCHDGVSVHYRFSDRSGYNKMPLGKFTPTTEEYYLTSIEQL